MMKIVTGRPPQWIWDQAHAMFGIDDKSTVYTYGDFLFNPAGLVLPVEMIAHEETHMRQQAKLEGGKDEWWRTYFANPVFRAAQEAEAYGKQYQVYCRGTKQRDSRAIYLHQCALLLSSELYQLNLSLNDAKAAIRHASGV